jgi:ABC-2 type transport system permease protein
MYRQPFRFVLTYVLPVAFISTVPARALTRGAGPALIAAGLAIGIGAIALVGLVWKAALKRYTSATS